MKIAFFTALDEHIPEADKISADVFINSPSDSSSKNFSDNHKPISTFNISKEYDAFIVCDFLSLFLQLPLINFRSKTKIYFLSRGGVAVSDYNNLRLDGNGKNLVHNLLDKLDGIFCNDTDAYLKLTEQQFPFLKSSRTKNGNIFVQRVHPYYETFADAIIDRVQSDLYEWNVVNDTTSSDSTFSDNTNDKVQAFIVNLENRPGRYQKMLKELEGVNDITPSRFNALTSVIPPSSEKEMKHVTRYTDAYQKIKGNPYNNIYRTLDVWPKGALGCMRSHYELWKKILVEGEGERTPYIIFEDDCFPVSHFNSKFRLVMNYLQSDNNWDICHLGTHDDISIGLSRSASGALQVEIDQTVKDFGNGLSIQKWNPSTRRTHGGGLFSYIINKKGAYNLLECVNKYGICQPVDWFTTEMISELIMYKVGPMHLFISPYFNTKSDIQNTSSISNLLK